MHQARWMSKVLYAFKIWMSQGQCHLTKKEEEGLARICTFFRGVYAKAWMEATFPAQAPWLDLKLITALGTYEKIDPKVGDIALTKLSTHLTYVSEELVRLAFFNSAVSSEIKVAIVGALHGGEPKVGPQKSDFQNHRSGISTLRIL